MEAGKGPSEAPQPVVPGQAEVDAYLSEPVAGLEAWPRVTCPTCNGSKRYYCAECLVWAGVPDGVELPRLTLPIEIDCVLADYRKRATGIQAAVVAPSTVKVLEFPDKIPDFDPDTTLVVFPSEDSTTLEEVGGGLDRIERLVLIDSRWNNTTRVLELPAIQRCRKVKLKHPPLLSRFWRYHSEGVGHVSSIEAMYYIVREYEEATGRRTTGGRLEELLYLFRMQLQVIDHSYDTDPTRSSAARPTQTEGKLRRLERQCGRSKKLKSFKNQIQSFQQQQEDQPPPPPPQPAAPPAQQDEGLAVGGGGAAGPAAPTREEGQGGPSPP